MLPIAATISGVGFEAQGRHEARRAQHAQRIVLEGHLGRQRRAQPAGREVGQSVEGIDERGVVERDRHRVHGEVPSRQIGHDVVGERHLRLAALGPVHIGAERRDLEPLAVLLAADRAEPLALQPHRVGPRAHRGFDRIGSGVGRDVDVDVVAVEQGVAHAAADEVGAVPALGEPRRKLLRR